MHGLNAEFVQPAIVASKTVAGAQCRRAYFRDGFESIAPHRHIYGRES
jgi:hypothetical protein